jgi:hypothetical protein
MGRNNRELRVAAAGSNKARRPVSNINGREYFTRLERELKIEGMSPDKVRALPPLELKRGAVESKLGGRIARDLKRLSPQEISERRSLSEQFLKQPVETVRGEVDDGDRPAGGK